MKTNFLKLIINFISVFLLASCISAKYPPPEVVLTTNELLVNTVTEAGLEAIETPKGVVIYFPSVMFLLDSADISTESLNKIQFIAGVSNQEMFADRQIFIEGHTDSKGSDAYNLELSEKRANSVAGSLNSYQLDKNRLTVKWHGEARPRVPNKLSDGSDNPEGRATNRRVEVIFLN